MVRVNDRGLVELIYEAAIYDGKIIIPLEVFERESRGLQGEFTLTLTRRMPDRSEFQNNAFWWYMEAISNQTGYTPDEVKIEVQKKFLSRQRNDPQTGEIHTVILDTSDLNTKEHNQLMHMIRVWAREFWNIHLPEPDPEMRKDKKL